MNTFLWVLGGVGIFALGGVVTVASLVGYLWYVLREPAGK